MFLENINFPFFSVIIPVYNVESYIHQCVSSVLSQEYRNFEIILVDDESPDKCPEICDELATKDSRIKVFHKKNGGLSDARNFGIKYSSGKYLMFLDSDDYWDGNNHLQSIFDILKKDLSIDTLLFRSKHLLKDGIIDDRNSKAPSSNSIVDSNKQLIEMIKLGTQSSSACLRVVRKDLIIGNDIFFEKNLIGEDSDWFIHLCLFAKKHFEYPKTFYVYRKNREGSITSTISKKTFDDQLYIIDKWSRNINENRYDENLKTALRGFLAYLYSVLILHISKLHDTEYNFYLKELEKRSYILKYSINKKSIVIKYINSLFGLRCTAKLINIMYYYVDKNRNK